METLGNVAVSQFHFDRVAKVLYSVINFKLVEPLEWECDVGPALAVIAVTATRTVLSHAARLPPYCDADTLNFFTCTLLYSMNLLFEPN